MTGDGIPDVILSHIEGNILLVNDGMGNDESDVHYATMDIALDDMNDGHIDIVMANWGGGNQLLLNDGNGTFLVSNLQSSCQATHAVFG